RFSFILAVISLCRSGTESVGDRVGLGRTGIGAGSRTDQIAGLVGGGLAVQFGQWRADQAGGQCRPVGRVDHQERAGAAARRVVVRGQRFRGAQVDTADLVEPQLVRVVRVGQGLFVET